jgi:hypothetical protein
MKPFKVVLILLLLLGGFSAILYTSCTKDSCKGTTCINGGTCGGGTCNCKKGVGGLNCELIYRDLYDNTYKGTGIDDSNKFYINNTLAFTGGVDTNYTQMNLLWTNPGVRVVTFPIILENNSTTGSTFIIPKTGKDTVFYEGNGHVSATSVSITLTETHPNSTPVVITLNSFTKQ